MGRAIEMGQGEQLITLKQQGQSLEAIAQQLNLSLSTIRQLSARFKQQCHRFGGLIKSHVCQLWTPTSPERTTPSTGQSVAQTPSPPMGYPPDPTQTVQTLWCQTNPIGANPTTMVCRSTPD